MIRLKRKARPQEPHPDLDAARGMFHGVWIGLLMWLVLIAALLLLTGAAWAGQGWYLFVPPVSDEDRSAPYLSAVKVLTSSPLSRWRQWGAYGSAPECEATKDTMAALNYNFYLKSNREYLESISRDAPAISGHWRWASERDHASSEAFSSALCIASDDPRLAR